MGLLVYRGWGRTGLFFRLRWVRLGKVLQDLLLTAMLTPVPLRFEYFLVWLDRFELISVIIESPPWALPPFADRPARG